jgi:hypothetical protein
MPDVDLDALDALERSLAKTPPHAGTAAQLKFEHFTRKHHESLLGAINAYVANLNEQRVGHPLD